MKNFLSAEICTELSKLSLNATPRGATLGGIVYARMASDFGRFSASLENDTSSETQAQHAEAMTYITDHLREITVSHKHLLGMAEILMPVTVLTGGALTKILDRLPTEDANPFERSIALLTEFSLAPITGARTLARAACNIPLLPKGLAPLLFVGVENHFPGLAEYADSGDTTRLVQAYRIAYGVSMQLYRGYFPGI